MMMTRADMEAVCEAFREEMLDGDSSKGMCAKITWALQGYLSVAYRLDTKVMEGTVGDWNHLWLEASDGTVIDCTADQFGDYPKIHVGAPLDIHKGGRRWGQCTCSSFSEVNKCNCGGGDA